MTILITNPRERTRFLRFLVVGTVGAVIDFSTFNICSVLLHILPVVSQAISFTLAVISNFIWNRYWTYPDSRAKPLSSQLFQFFIVNAIGLGIRTPIFAGSEKPLIGLYSAILPAGFFLKPQFLGHNTALAIAVIVVLLWNFFVNRYWTYNDVQS